MDIPDIVESACEQSERLANCIKRSAEKAPIYVSTPNATTASHFHDTARTGSSLRVPAVCYRRITWDFAFSTKPREIAEFRRLDEISPLAQRFDVKSEIATGFPYSIEHTSILAELMATLIQASPQEGTYHRP